MAETKSDPATIQTQTIQENFSRNLKFETVREDQIQRLTLDNARLINAHSSATAEWAECMRIIASQRATLQAIVRIADEEKPADIDKATYDYSRLIAVRNIAESELIKNKPARKDKIHD